MPQDSLSETESTRTLSVSSFPSPVSHWSRFAPWGLNSPTLPGLLPAAGWGRPEPIKSGIFSKILVDVKNVGERAPCSYLPLPSSYVFLTEHRPNETVCPHLGCSCDDLGSPPVLPMFKVSDEFLKYSKPLLRNRRKIVKSLVLFNIFRCF